MSDLKQIVLIWVAGLISLAVLLSMPFVKEGLLEIWWGVFTSLVLVTVRFENSFLHNQLWVSIVTCLVMVGVGAAYWLKDYFFIFASWWAVLIWLCFYLGHRYDAFWFSGILIVVFGIISFSRLNTSFDTEMAIVSIGVGASVALLCRSTLWPLTFERQFREHYIAYFKAAKQYQQVIFTLYLSRDYPGKIYEYEKTLHHKRFALLKPINQMRELVQHMPEHLKKTHIQIVNQLDSLAELLIALGSLRYRIRDFSTLEVCEKELQYSADVFVRSMDKIITGSKRDCHCPEDNSEPLPFQNFDALYQNTLQFIINEPTVFLIFIHILKKVFAELKMLASKKLP